MKRLFALLLVLTLGATCAACRQNPPAPTEPTAPSTPTTATDPAPSTPADVPFTPIASVEDYFDYALYAPPGKAGSIQYLFHEPIRDTGEAYPLIIFLHGKGDSVSTYNLGTASQLIRGLIPLENANEAYSAYTLVPVTPFASEGWWSDWQLEFFKSLIVHLVNSYNIDPKRVYITGISMGGYTACQLVNEMPANTFAAVVPLSGAYCMLYPFDLHDTAFRIYHAANDPVVNVSKSRNLYQQLLEYQHPKVEYFEEAYGSHLSPLYTAYGDPNFYFWLFKQHLPLSN